MKLAAETYGSDAAGLICCYLFDGAGGCRQLSSPEAEQWLQQPQATQDKAFLWLHFNLANSNTEKWLNRHLALSPMFFDALHEGTRSTRIEYVDDSLIAVINDVLFDFSFDASEISTLYLSVSLNMLVSARSKPLRSIDHVRAAVKKGETFATPVELLVHLLRDQADVLMQIVRDIADEVDVIEDRLLSNRVDGSRLKLGSFRRLLVRLQRLMAPEPSALFRLLNRPPGWVGDHDLLDLRQSTEEFSTVLQETTSLQERIKLLQEEIASQINEQNNRSLFVLTVVTVLVLPINIISGMLGMNVGGIPLAERHDGFWIIVSIVATFTLIAVWFAFRERE